MLNKNIYLSESEQLYLKEIVRKGVHNSHVITRARVLLMLDRTGKTDHVRYKRTAEYAQISVQAVYNMRDEFPANHDIEDVLEVYSRPYDEKRPVVCMDEKPFQLLDDILEPIPMGKSNHTRKYDCEYIRKGSCSIFMFTEPLGQWREAHALAHRISEDWARQMKWLIDEVYSDAEKIILVLDNLNTHTTASFYKVFPPEEAFRLTQRLEIHYTPKHGSWLDIAEIELSALTIQCLLKERIPSLDALNNTLASWSLKRNCSQKGVSWHFILFFHKTASFYEKDTAQGRCQ